MLELQSRRVLELLHSFPRAVGGEYSNYRHTSRQLRLRGNRTNREV